MSKKLVNLVSDFLIGTITPGKIVYEGYKFSNALHNENSSNKKPEQIAYERKWHIGIISMSTAVDLLSLAGMGYFSYKAYNEGIDTGLELKSLTPILFGVGRGIFAYMLGTAKRELEYEKQLEINKTI